MPASTLTISLIPNAISNTVVVSIPQSLQSREAAGGSSAAYEAISAIFKSGTFTDGQSNWYSAFQILKIVAS
jgi:hypothetical protein